MIGDGWKLPPPGFGCYVAVRWDCGHTALRDITDIVLVKGVTDDMLWMTQSVDADGPCEACGGTDFWSSV